MIAALLINWVARDGWTSYTELTGLAVRWRLQLRRASRTSRSLVDGACGALMTAAVGSWGIVDEIPLLGSLRPQCSFFEKNCDVLNSLLRLSVKKWNNIAEIPDA